MQSVRSEEDFAIYFNYGVVLIEDVDVVSHVAGSGQKTRRQGGSKKREKSHETRRDDVLN